MGRSFLIFGYADGSFFPMLLGSISVTDFTTVGHIATLHLQCGMFKDTTGTTLVFVTWDSFPSLDLYCYGM